MARLKRAKTACEVDCGTITSTAPLILKPRRGEVLAAFRPAFGDADEEEQMHAAARSCFPVRRGRAAPMLLICAPPLPSTIAFWLSRWTWMTW